MQTTLSERIQERMKAMKLSNAQLAAACQVKPPTSFNWASGKTKNIKGVPLLLAAKALGVTPEWLSTGVGMKHPQKGAPPEIRDEAIVEYLPAPKMDDMTSELLRLFSELDATGKNEYLVFLRGFVAGRRPHRVGKASAMAG